MVALNRFFSRFSWDVVGFSASAICAVHCLAVPVLLMISSLSGFEILHNHDLETFILLFSSVIGAVSIFPSWYRHHRKLLPMLIFLTGIAFVGSGRFNHTIFLETVLTTSGAVLVATSHLINWKLCRPFHSSPEAKEIV
jgi:hypothetical protein